MKKIQFGVKVFSFSKIITVYENDDVCSKLNFWLHDFNGMNELVRVGIWPALYYSETRLGTQVYKI